MRINGILYTFARDMRNDGYDIYAAGQWVGWSAGPIRDAMNTAREIARSVTA